MYVPYVGWTGCSGGEDCPVSITTTEGSDSGELAWLKIGYYEQCEGDVCSLDLVNLKIGVEDWSISQDGHSVSISDMTLKLNSHVVAPYDSATGTVVFLPGTVEALVSFHVATDDESDDGRILMKNTLLTGTVIPGIPGSFQLNGMFVEHEDSESNFNLTITFGAEGNFDCPTCSIPPSIETIAPEVPVECNDNYSANVPIEGAGSFDYQGLSLEHVWTSEKGGQDVYSSELENPVVNVALGERVVKHVIANARGVFVTDEVSVTVEDTTPPYLSVRNPHAVTCVPAPSWVYLQGVVFSVNDLCTDNDTIDLSGEITKINTIRLDNPKSISLDTADPNYLMEYLPLGTHEITWHATDEFGNTATLVQEFTVQYESGEQCCERSYTLWEGTPDPDVYIAHPWIDPVWNNQLMSLCAFGLGAADIIMMANASEPPPEDEVNDYINFGEGGAAGWGGGFLQWRPGESTIISESGADIIIFNRDGDDNQFYDMEGNDNIEGSNGNTTGSAGEDTIFGGYGDDFITAFGGDDYIVPGPGKDIVRAGDGDDIIVVYNVCELVPGEVIQGDAGYDRVYLPISKQEATDVFNLQLIGVEEVIVDTSSDTKGYADCAVVYF